MGSEAKCRCYRPAETNRPRYRPTPSRRQGEVRQGDQTPPYWLDTPLGHWPAKLTAGTVSIPTLRRTNAYSTPIRPPDSTSLRDKIVASCPEPRAANAQSQQVILRISTSAGRKTRPTERKSPVPPRNF